MAAGAGGGAGGGFDGVGCEGVEDGLQGGGGGVWRQGADGGAGAVEGCLEGLEEAWSGGQDEGVQAAGFHGGASLGDPVERVHIGGAVEWWRPSGRTGSG